MRKTKRIVQEKEETTDVEEAVEEEPQDEEREVDEENEEKEETNGEETIVETKTRPVLSKEMIEKESVDLLSAIETEIDRLRTSTVKTKGIKFLRTIKKQIKMFSSHALRMCRRVKPRQKRTGGSTGLMKPVAISDELAEFIGSEPGTMHARTEITKHLCQYIKENNLQQASDKRFICVADDPKLKALLRIKSTKPVKYCFLQRHLRVHYLK
jgi:chromatin remodeling complex protein RSC6